MAEGVKYAPHLHTSIKDEITQWTGNSDLDVFQYTNHGILNKEAIFLNDGTYVTVSRNGEITEHTYYGAPFAEPTDIALTPFTLRSILIRPAVWLHKKMRPDSYQDIDLDRFAQELDDHGGIDFLQVISPPRAAQTDYIKCADGQRYVLDKPNSKILRLRK